MPTSRPGTSSEGRAPVRSGRPRVLYAVMPSSRTTAPLTRGFTLIELAITLMVLAIAAAFVAPSIGRGLDGLRARAEVSGFVGYLRAAREQAVTRGEVQEVHLDPETRTVAITTDGGSTVRSSRSFSYLVQIDPSPPSARIVRFQPQGLSTGGTFHILGRGDRRYVITVDPLTGRVMSRVELGS